MNVLHVLASLSSSWGGPPRVLRDLTRELGRMGVDNVVVGLTSRGSLPVQFSQATKLVECGPAAIARLAVPASLGLIPKLIKEIESADLVHIHELWHMPHALAAFISRILERPYVITPHGELQDWPLGQHRFLKGFALRSYEKQILAKCAGIHVLTRSERDAVTALCPGIPISVIPNGLDINLVDDQLKTVPSLNALGHAVTEPYLLFVGRLSPEKNLDLLLEAFSIVHDEENEVSLVLAGPDERGMWGALQERAHELGIAKRLQYLGLVTEPNKYRLFSEARAFLLPSLSEGLSLSLLEALACGTPAIISTGCNLPEVETEGAGRVVKPIARLFAQAIQDTLRDSEARERMCANARKLAISRFSVNSMATGILEFYAKALAHQPEVVSQGTAEPHVGKN